jgi:hypothetical protein
MVYRRELLATTGPTTQPNHQHSPLHTDPHTPLATVPPENPDPRGHKDLKEKTVGLAHKESLDFLDHKDPQGAKEKMVSQVYQEKRETKEIQDLVNPDSLDCPGKRETRVNLDTPDKKENRELMDNLVVQDLKETRAGPDMMEKKENQEIQEPRGSRDHQVLRETKAILDKLDQKGSQDHSLLHPPRSLPHAHLPQDHHHHPKPLVHHDAATAGYKTSNTHTVTTG